ncbi:MAG: NADH-quinone oxidoreductase subunit NuoK [Phycisphaerae bacterium]|nr:NADH-quinone oxidoreductase subunit NuoK [Phycisphaerae bacterium]
MIQYLAEHGPGLIHWLILSNVLFAIGIYGLLSRRNAIGILMSVELMLNSAAMNAVVFNRFLTPRAVDGEILALFVIAVAAAEAVVALAIFVALFRNRSSIDVNRMDSLKG